MAWVVEVDNDTSAEVQLIVVELVDLVEHYNLLVLERPSAAAVVVSKQSMGMVLVVDVAVALVPLVVEPVPVAYRRHWVAVVSSFVTAEGVVDQVELDNLYVDSPSRNYYTSSVLLWLDHTVVAFHYRLYRTDAWACASVDTVVVVVVDDPFDADVHVAVGNHGKGLA